LSARSISETRSCTTFGSEYELLDEDRLHVVVGGSPGGEVEVVHRSASITLWAAKGWDYIRVTRPE
jgi:hypothetical protein